ncbi:MAG: hypothetical protein AAF950_09700 [Pseudomonadota bacterium]
MLKTDKIAAVLAVLGFLMVSACAATATGTQRSAISLNAPAPVLNDNPPAGTALVVLRYPAVVDTDSDDAYRLAYVSKPIGSRGGASPLDSPDVDTIAETSIVKSSYFALSVYKELVQRLPEHSVLLSPHMIKLDADGALTSEPITQSESLPSVLTVDFAAYSFPDPERMMNAEPLTFGDLITPLVTVSSDYRAAVPTGGVLLASQPLLSPAGGAGQEAMATSFSALQSGKFTRASRPLDFISHISGGPSATPPLQGLSLSAHGNSVQSYPVEKILLDRDALDALLAPETDSDIDPLENVFSSAFADRVVDLLNDIDMNRAAMVQRAGAISQFDPSLAALSLMGASDADYQARLNYAERLIEAERKYLSVQSLRLFDGIHNGEMGHQVRDMLQAEYEHLQERRKLAQQQNAAAAFAVLGAVAAGVAIANVDNNGSVNLGEQILVQALLSGATYAGFQAFSYNQQSKAIGANYLTSIVPALSEQTTVQIDLIESSETITAIRFEDLQEKLQTLYTENQRSLDTIATNCAYLHDGDDPIGRWSGVCEEGVAAGPGVGVVSYDDGTAREYYGYALNGQPSGAGFLIIHAGSESYSVEGSFENGLANGIMRVSAPGSADRLRLYENGEDVGAAPRDAEVVSPFAMPDMESVGTPVARILAGTMRG